MCRDPRDTTTKVSSCVEPSKCFKNIDFDATDNFPLALQFKMSYTRKSASFVVIMLLHKRSTHVHSQKKLKLHFGESFTLNLQILSHLLFFSL